MTGPAEQRGGAETPSAPADVRRMAEQRADARAAKEFTKADTLRDRIADRGWVVTDEPGGFSLEPAEAGEPASEAVAASEVPSALDREPVYDVAIH